MPLQVEIKVLPGGRSRIHWFVRDPKGPCKTAGEVRRMGPNKIALGGAVGRIACKPALTSVAPFLDGNLIRLVKHSDDVRAVTCPECMATQEYAGAMRALMEEEDAVTIDGSGEKARADHRSGRRTAKAED